MYKQHQQQYYNQFNYNNVSGSNVTHQTLSNNQAPASNQMASNFLTNSGQFNNNSQTTSSSSVPMTYSSNYLKKKNQIDTSPHTPKYSPRKCMNNINTNCNNNSSFVAQGQNTSNQTHFQIPQNQNINYTSTTPRSSEKYNANGVNSNFSGYVSNYNANCYKNGNLSPYNTSSKQYTQLINEQDSQTPQNNSSNISIANSSNQLYNSRNATSVHGNRASGSQKKSMNQFEFIDVENIPQTQTMDLIDKFLKNSSALQSNNIAAENSTPSERKKYKNDLSPFKYSTNKVLNTNQSNTSAQQGGNLSIIQQQLEIFKQTSFTPSRKSQQNPSQTKSSNSNNQSLSKNSQNIGSQSQAQSYGQSQHHNSQGKYQPSITSSTSSNSKVFHQTNTPQQFREPLKNVNNINLQQYGQLQLREDKVPLQNLSSNNLSYTNQRNYTPTNSSSAAKKLQTQTPQQQYLHYQYSNTPQNNKNNQSMVKSVKNSSNLNQNIISNNTPMTASKNLLFGSTNNSGNYQIQSSAQENAFANVISSTKNDLSQQGPVEQQFPLNIQSQSSNKFKQTQKVGCENIQLNTNASNYSGEFGFTPINNQKSTSKVSTFNLDVSRDLSMMINNNFNGHNASNNQIHNTSNNLFNLNFLDKDSSNIFNFHNDKDQSQFSYNYIEKDYSTINNNVSKELSTFQTPLKGGKQQLSYMLETCTNLDNITTNNLTICSTTNNNANNNNNTTYTSNYNNYNTQKTNTKLNNNSYILEKSPNTTDQKNPALNQQQQYKKNSLILYDSPRFNNEENRDKSKDIYENDKAIKEEQFQQPANVSTQNNNNNSSNKNNFQQMISDLKNQYNQKQSQLQQIKQNLDFSANKKSSNEEGYQFQTQQKVIQEEDLVSKICAQKNNSINNIPSNNQASPLTPASNYNNIYNDTSNKKNQSSSSYTSIKKKNFYEEALQQADQSVKNVFKKFDNLLKNKFETMQNSRKNITNSNDDKGIQMLSNNQQQNQGVKQADQTISTAAVSGANPSLRNNSNTGTSRSSNNVINQVDQSNISNNIANSYSYNTKNYSIPNPSSQSNNNNLTQNNTTNYIPSSAYSNATTAQKDKERERTPPHNPVQNAEKVQIKPVQPSQQKAIPSQAPASSSSNDKKDPYPIQYHKSLEKFIFGKVLGLGSYAVVRVVQDQNTKEKYALKTYEKKKLQDPQKRKNVAREVKILSKIKHLNIIRLYDVIETNSQLHLLMEYPCSTPLNAHIKSKPHRKLCEEEAKVIFSQLVEAVKYCHRKSIVHRDIKLENVLYDSNTQTVKLIDFGFSIALAPGTKLNIFCGTPSYMAPEIVNKKDYTFPVDTWALGILLFKALNGNFPFRGQDDKELYRRINSCKLDFQPHVSSQARSLISKILRHNSNERYTPEQILQDEWFKVKTPTNFAITSSQYAQN
ncbi:Serine/Threonine kinase domain protein (macronuclear) [Tetrahymena thermophila SB210]|uniref:Serine/Threonine kinase domain protein n=1 Tax=Tetrahymena thermophila (strain SB210) TaxID=312017 RepID=Q23B13_TETTS|nr:Serine/Threonine kinase domain protein [Tetrahymena thermophila SB210]EAR93671.2 Serine/Threonine kinase domain protein [Tetrahymena thermophila SB210]|eukprot:XP_001013916.2 Serine/Threonine kinase domain protein [Tetrahymena thermophila SB210]